ncbi:AAA family ATPase [Hydrocarboniphaga sp.]|uniref:AAA family ATPase n=1 Tax=Hydrocarboniphaga sp. TaxID=2033016 RepID=UPI003D12F15F
MRRLTVENFSCVDRAELILGRLTVIIGPQGSGKSVLSKLTYFFQDLLLEQYKVLEDGGDIRSFKEHIKIRFKELFPVSAWGNRRFCIEFEAGAFHVRMTRVERNQILSDNMRITLSPFFEGQYKDSLDAIKHSVERTRNSNSADEFDGIWTVREAAEKRIAAELGQDHVQAQTFIPAGRAFFTSVGKALAVFENGGILDPIILSFGRLFANLRDRRFFISSAERSARRNASNQKQLESILGGKIVWGRENNYIEASDGRKVPFSALSSGQQELMPLWVVLDYLSGRRGAKRLVFIEEPEAHLFPLAQSHLVEVLASLTFSATNSLDMVLTTHSPYVLAKINNLIKAASIAQLGERYQRSVAEIVRPTSWVPAGATQAYCIHQSELLSIIDDDGLIDGSYLDHVSGDISEEFTRLLAIETENG